VKTLYTQSSHITSQCVQYQDEILKQIFLLDEYVHISHLDTCLEPASYIWIHNVWKEFTQKMQYEERENIADETNNMVLFDLCR